MAEQISNGDVLNFNKVHGKNKCLEFLIDSKALADGCNEQPSARAIELSIKKLVGDAKNVKRSATRSGDSRYEIFLNQCYEFPKHDSQKCVPKVTSPESLDMNCSFREIKRKSLELCKGKHRVVT